MTILKTIQAHLKEAGIPTGYDNIKHRNPPETLYLDDTPTLILITIKNTTITIQYPTKIITTIDLNHPHSLQKLVTTLNKLIKQSNDNNPPNNPSKENKSS